MEQLGIERLEIDSHIEQKLFAKHDRLEFVEVEQALIEGAIVVQTGEVIYEVYARTFGGLHLLVVLAWKGEGIFKVVTAFPMSPRQVRWFESKQG